MWLRLLRPRTYRRLRRRCVMADDVAVDSPDFEIIEARPAFPERDAKREWEAAHAYLDSLGVPNVDDGSGGLRGAILSLKGRIEWLHNDGSGGSGQ